MINRYVGLASVMLLASCSAGTPTSNETQAATLATPAAQCSAQSTYDAMTAQIAAKVSPAWRGRGNDSESRAYAEATSPARIAALLRFYDPTVEEFDAKTGKVSCSAKLAIKGPVIADSAISRLTILDRQPDQITIQIRYLQQVTADTGKPLLSLAQIDDITEVATSAAIMPIIASKVDESERERDSSIATAADNTAGPTNAGVTPEQQVPANATD